MISPPCLPPPCPTHISPVTTNTPPAYSTTTLLVCTPYSLHDTYISIGVSARAGVRGSWSCRGARRLSHLSNTAPSTHNQILKPMFYCPIYTLGCPLHTSLHLPKQCGGCTNHNTHPHGPVCVRAPSLRSCKRTTVAPFIQTTNTCYRSSSQ